MKFAKPLKDGCTAIYCNNDRAKFDEFDNPELKDVKHPQFHGQSCRSVQISLSEDYLKPKFGTKVFGDILANAIKNMEPSQYVFVSDSGFRPEAEVLVEEFGAENVVLIRIHRENCTFDGDSRSYINLSDLGVKTFDIDNNSSFEDFENELIEAITEVENKNV